MRIYRHNLTYILYLTPRGVKYETNFYEAYYNNPETGCFFSWWILCEKETSSKHNPVLQAETFSLNALPILIFTYEIPIEEKAIWNSLTDCGWGLTKIAHLCETLIHVDCWPLIQTIQAKSNEKDNAADYPWFLRQNHWFPFCRFLRSLFI